MTIDELYREIQTRGIPADSEAVSGMEQLIRLVLEWNEKMNLTAITDPEEAYEKHLLDCLIPLSHVVPSGRVCDVGSGAGFPGLVWAAALPDTSFTLLEPREKRCTFLRAAVKELGLVNTQIVCGRAEDYAEQNREVFDAVTARAVANLAVLSELCVPLVRPGGMFLSLKGSRGEEEMQEAFYALSLLGCKEPECMHDVLPGGEERILIKAEKERPTPKKYPRSYAQIKQKPLMEKR